MRNRADVLGKTNVSNEDGQKEILCFIEVSSDRNVMFIDRILYLCVERVLIRERLSI